MENTQHTNNGNLDKLKWKERRNEVTTDGLKMVMNTDGTTSTSAKTQRSMGNGVDELIE